MLCEKCIRRTGLKVEAVKPDECLICSGLLWRIDEIARYIAMRLRGYEFKTFSVGSRVYGSLKALEEYLGVRSIKTEFNRELSSKLSELLGTKPVRENPDVVIIYDLENLDLEIEIMPIYVYGRYRKRVRGLSQTRWVCGFCGGKGCEVCRGTGRRYLSVEELIGEPMLSVFEGKDYILHGSGREDVDARMLGTGRPFIMEIRKPRRRYVDLKELEKVINESAKGKVVVSDLRFAKPRDVEYLKSAGFRKVYRVKVMFEREVSEVELARAVRELGGRVVEQWTPLRVLHRRANLLRRRMVHGIDVLLHKGRVAVLRIEADSGLYIKELVSGDEGRTKPSLSELLGVSARVEKLDVVEVRGGLDDIYGRLSR